uniref:Uncharacterized protein n=1 Tax=Streptomyces avermitilis TaxID=33903 RepID=A0A499VF97_STRAX|nr:hypothetical protein SAVMC3_57520 [Streptomyces avermitilis]
MSASRLVTTAWPIPAEARTTTDSVVTIRMDQPGRLGRLGRTGGRRAGEGRGRRGGRAAGERGGVGMGGHLREGMGVGIREHRRPIRSAARSGGRAARARVPRSR